MLFFPYRSKAMVASETSRWGKTLKSARAYDVPTMAYPVQIPPSSQPCNVSHNEMHLSFKENALIF